MQEAERGVIPFPDRVSRPADFSAFFAEEHAKVLKALYFMTGNRADAAELDAGRLPQALGAMGHDRPDRRSHGVPVPRRAERIADASAFRTPRRTKDRRTPAFVPIRSTRSTSAKTFDTCCSNWRRVSAPPSSCSTSTTTARKRPDTSWASVHRPFAPSPPKDAPSSGPPEVHMAELTDGLRDGHDADRARPGRVERAGPNGTGVRRATARSRLGAGCRDHGRHRVVRLRSTGSRQGRHLAGDPAREQVRAHLHDRRNRRFRRGDDPRVRRRRDARPLARWHDDRVHDPRLGDRGSRRSPRCDWTAPGSASSRTIPSPRSTRAGRRTGSNSCTSGAGDDGNLRLMVMNADGTNVREIPGTHQTADFNPARWSPDGSTILYTSFKDGSADPRDASRHGWSHPLPQSRDGYRPKSAALGRRTEARSRSRAGCARPTAI